MQSDIWSTSEQRHALVGPGDLWKMKRDFQIDFLTRFGLKPDHWLMDLGCGTLRGGIPLIEYLQSGHYTGIEVRKEVLEEAYRELVEYGFEDKEPRLVHVDFLSNLELGFKYDFIWSFSVLIHLEDSVLEQAIAAIGRHLKSNGVCYANVFLGESPNGIWQGFPVVHRLFSFYQEAFYRHGFRIEDIGSLMSYGHIHPRLTYEHQLRQRMLKVTRFDV